MNWELVKEYEMEDCYIEGNAFTLICNGHPF